MNEFTVFISKMKLLLVFSLFFNLNSISTSETLNSTYEKRKDYGLKASYQGSKLSTSQQSSVFKCVFECNKKQFCNVAVFSKNASICELFSASSLTNDSFEYKDLTFTCVKKGVQFFPPTRLRL